MYAGEYYANSHNLNFSKFDGSWIAKYSSTKPKVSGTSIDLWQYTSSGRVSGISGNVDLNKIQNSSVVKSWFADTSSHSTASYYSSISGVKGIKIAKAVYEYNNFSLPTANGAPSYFAGKTLAVKGITKNSKDVTGSN